MLKITTIGLDLAKRVFQVHAIAADGTVVARRQLRRAEMLKFFGDLQPCLIAWKPALPRTTGAESFVLSDMKFA